MWLSNSKKYATDGFWKSVHEVGSCTKWWGTVGEGAHNVLTYDSTLFLHHHIREFH
jgi:hypothetical protein